MPGGEAMDTVVLACTHFPLLQDELAAAFGPGVSFVHGADGIARQIARLLDRQAFTRDAPDRALTTRPDAFGEAYAGALSRYGLSGVAGL